MQKRKASVTGPAYQVFADGIRRLEDPAIRQAVADYFAKYFAARSPSFDPQAWFEATGGLITRKTAA